MCNACKQKAATCFTPRCGSLSATCFILKCGSMSAMCLIYNVKVYLLQNEHDAIVNTFSSAFLFQYTNPLVHLCRPILLRLSTRKYYHFKQLPKSRITRSFVISGKTKLHS